VSCLANIPNALVRRVSQPIDKNIPAHGVPSIALARSTPMFPSHLPVGILAALAAFLINSLSPKGIHAVTATFLPSADVFGFRPEFLFPAMLA
jgi:hypothetical protein